VGDPDLERQRLVESRPKSGTRVRPPQQWNQLDPDVLRWRLETSDMDSYLAKLFQLRCAVEPAAASIAAVRAGEEDSPVSDPATKGMVAAKVNEKFVAAILRFTRASIFATRNESSGRSRKCSKSRCAEFYHRRRVAAIVRARWSSTAPCSMRSQHGIPKVRAKRPRFCLNHSAADLVKIRGREFAMRPRRRALCRRRVSPAKAARPTSRPRTARTRIIDGLLVRGNLV